MLSQKWLHIVKASCTIRFPKCTTAPSRTVQVVAPNLRLHANADRHFAHPIIDWSQAPRFTLPLALSSWLLLTVPSVTECGGDSRAPSAVSKTKKRNEDKKLRCNRCEVKRPRTEFSKKQIKRANRICKTCAAGAATKSGQSRRKTTATCNSCGETKPHTEFAQDRVRGKGPMLCRDCAEIGRPKATSSSLGSQDCKCSHCGAALFKAEAGGFCCNHGKYAVDFSKYFRNPGDDLLKVGNSLAYVLPDHMIG